MTPWAYEQPSFKLGDYGLVDEVFGVISIPRLGLEMPIYRKHGQFDFTAPAILFACLLFSLTAPTYIWTVLG